ncbi:30S ribosomal protein S4 [Micromonospora sp. WMMD961]|uniref:30S ribosomal protein S4 n=1 Tax=unclassified Micromonospora TaxID=2617518 RepID=UPI002416FF5A|nr:MULTISPECIES: 30S ribosomal protein S4 [unclassified Micromonospora]MDG4782046.1 30S ribosomal protein S4 [Micromonospora sp. WMMD961]WFE99901.1 30S ribosomal protein S4 [Micromonospora sp. WMMD964]
MNQTRPKVKRSRALGIALTPKCVRYFERRPFPPGQHGRARRTTSDYKVRLLEKQRLKAQYDLHEGQLRRAFDRAVRRPGKTGEELIVELESRLDALVLRAGLARTIYQARQVVTHQHVTVNGRRVDRPSARLQPGDVIAVAERSRGKAPFVVAAAGAHAPERPAPYLDVTLSDLTARLVRLPLRSEVPVVCDEQLVVEYYSR